jgi:hypothetical protein
MRRASSRPDGQLDALAYRNLGILEMAPVSSFLDVPAMQVSGFTTG